MRFRFLIFISILLTLISYTGFKVVAFFPQRKNLGWTYTVIFFALMVGWEFLHHSNVFSTDSGWFLALAWVGSFFMGLWATFVLLSLPIDILYTILSLIRKLIFWGHDTSRWKDFFTRVIPAFLAVISLGMSIWGLKEALTGPRIREVTITIPHLPEKLEELRIVQFTDLHASPILRRRYVENVARKIMELRPHLIFFTGDMADGKASVMTFELQPLATLKAPGGVYYVTGNHEYYWEANTWIQEARHLGFIPLINENRVINFEGVPILIGGVTDTSAEQFDPAQKSDPYRAVASTETSLFKILLAHRPNSAFDAEKAGFDLQLSGHTHAGQFFPFNIPVALTQPYYRGLNRHGNLWVYTSAGTGYWGPPNRFEIPAEITFLHLRKGT